MQLNKNNITSTKNKTHVVKVRRNSFYRRTFNLLDHLLLRKIFLRGVLGGFDAVVRFFAMSFDTGWPNVAIETQTRIFNFIVEKNKHTAFGLDHKLESVKTYDDFRTIIPVSSYEELFPYIERIIKGEKNILTVFPVEEFSKSSGTTNSRSKYIPTPNVYMKGNHLKASYDMISSYARSHPHTNIFSGKSIVISGSYSEIPGSQFRAGDISALMMNATPWWTAGAKPYNKKLALHPSWPHKAKEIVEKSLDKNIVLLGGTPTWMIEILEIAKEKGGVEYIRELWPNIEVFFHGAVAFAPYRKTIEKLIGKESFEFREVYNASEGFFAFEDSPKKNPGEMLLCTDHDIFYEFMPVEDCIPKGEAVPLKEVVTGIHYAMLITTTSGLFRYMVGDVVTFTTTSPYRLKIIGRTTQFMNAFGEEVVADNVVHAIKEASQVSGAEVHAFTVAPTFNAAPAQGAHEWAIEFKTAPKHISVFIEALDASLRRRNSDYDAKRTGDVILSLPLVRVVEEGTFRKFLESKGKLGAQNKVPLLSDNRTALEEILKGCLTLYN